MKRIALLVLLAGCAGRRSETPAPVVSAGSGNWPMYNGTVSGERFAALPEITTRNVAQLRQTCAFATADTVSFQTGIVAVDGILFFTAFNTTYAIDGSTCALKWKQTRPEPLTALKVNRGVAYYNGMVYRGTGDAHVLGLNAETGAIRWDVAIGDPQKGESVPMAPIAWNGLVFVGNAGGDVFGVTGRIYALDAASGRVVWQFNTVPDTGAPRATWPKASPENPPTGGAVWTSFALDEATGTLYVTTGNPAPDFVIALRPGENLYTNALLALDARTGTLRRYVQVIQNDFHDWDASAAPALVTTPGGHAFVLLAAKDGMFYGIDRGSVDSVALAVRYRTAVTTRDNVDTPLSEDRLTRFCPGSQGGVEWNGPTYQREQGTAYVNAIDWCTSVKLQRLDTLRGAPGQSWTGMDDPHMAFGRMDPTERWKGWVTAVNVETGEVRWKVQTPKPMVAGITATAGGLVFTGDLDGNVIAYDAANGRQLWRAPAGGAIGGGVIAFDAGGRQHIAAAAGLNSPIWPVRGGPARIVIWALPTR